MAATESLVRNHVATVIEATFTAAAPPELSVERDKLHASLAQDRPRAAAYPLRAYEDQRNVKVLMVEVAVQVFLQWDPQIDAEQSVDPAAIEDVAGRLRAAFGPGTPPAASDDLWFVRVRRIEYPPDPTGNVTRLEAELLAKATNQAAQHP